MTIKRAHKLKTADFKKEAGRKRIEDITLDLVILSPDMVVPIKSLPAKTDKIDLYIVQEECCDAVVLIISFFCE